MYEIYQQKYINNIMLSKLIKKNKYNLTLSAIILQYNTIFMLLIETNSIKDSFLQNFIETNNLKITQFLTIQIF